MSTAAAIRTLENDPDSPFFPPEVPAAEWVYRWQLDDAFKRGAQYALAWLAKSGRREPPPFPQGRSLERTVTAYVNHGRWLWDCPLCGSPYVASNDPRAFCVVCFNAGDGWFPLEFPPERAAIDELLGRRPGDDSRHWTDETVEQLQAENLAHGVDAELAGYEWIGAKDGTAIARNYLERLELDAAEQRRELAAARRRRLELER